MIYFVISIGLRSEISSTSNSFYPIICRSAMLPLQLSPCSSTLHHISFPHNYTLHPPTLFPFGSAFYQNHARSIRRLQAQDIPHTVLTQKLQDDDPFEVQNALTDTLINGFEPNVATFTALINSLCQSGKIKDAFQVFDKMSRLDCEPTINTYNCLLKGLCYVGRIEEAHELLTKIKKSVKPDIYTYTALMDGFCKVGRSNEAFEFLDEAVHMGLTPSVVTYNTLFNGYFKEGRPMSGLSLLRRMKEKKCKPDYISYSTLLHGLLKWGKTRPALQIYREMVGIGLPVDERMMNTLMRSLCRLSRKETELLKDVFGLLEDMKAKRISIYPCAHDLVIEALISGREIEKAFMQFNEMFAIGLCPRPFTFNIVIHALCSIGEVDKALGTLVLMVSNRKPGGIPYSVLINELNRQGRSLDSRIIFCMALRRGVVPRRKPLKYLVQAGQCLG